VGHAVPAATHCCYECGAAFVGQAQLMSHSNRVHAYRNPLRSRVDGTQCIVCLKEFWSRDRILQHLRSSGACGDWYARNVEPCSDAERQGRDRDVLEARRANVRAGLPIRVAVRPAVRAAGPLRREIAAPPA